MAESENDQISLDELFAAVGVSAPVADEKQKPTAVPSYSNEHDTTEDDLLSALGLPHFGSTTPVSASKPASEPPVDKVDEVDERKDRARQWKEELAEAEALHKQAEEASERAVQDSNSIPVAHTSVSALPSLSGGTIRPFGSDSSSRSQIGVLEPMQRPLGTVAPVPGALPQQTQAPQSMPQQAQGLQPTQAPQQAQQPTQASQQTQTPQQTQQVLQPHMHQPQGAAFAQPRPQFLQHQQPIPQEQLPSQQPSPSQSQISATPSAQPEPSVMQVQQPAYQVSQSAFLQGRVEQPGRQPEMPSAQQAQPASQQPVPSAAQSPSWPTGGQSAMQETVTEPLGDQPQAASSESEVAPPAPMPVVQDTQVEPVSTPQPLPSYVPSMPQTPGMPPAIIQEPAAEPQDSLDDLEKEARSSKLAHIIGGVLIAIAVVCVAVAVCLLTGVIDLSALNPSASTVSTTQLSSQATPSATAGSASNEVMKTGQANAAGQVVYGYVVRGVDGGTHEAVETATFGENGILESSTLEIQASSAEDAQALLEQLKTEFGESLKDGEAGDTSVVCTVSLPRDDLDRELYTELLSTNVSEFRIISE